MFDRIVPSRWLAPLVPTFVRERFGTRVDQALETADLIAHGNDEKAQSARTALFAFVVRVFSAFIAYVSQILLARWLGIYEYGIFVWVWVAVVIGGGLVCIGFPSAVVRFIPHYRVTGDDDSLRGIVFGSRLYSVIAASVIALIGIAGITYFENVVSSVYMMPVFLALICLPMLALAEVQDGIARAFSWMELAFSPTYLVRPLLIIIAMVSALWWGKPPTAATAMTAAIAATWATSIWQMLVMNQRLKSVVQPGVRSRQPKVWITVALPIFLVEGFFSLLMNVDILIAGIYLHPSQVAIYFAAVKTLALVHFVYFAVKAGVAQRFAHYFSAGETDALSDFARDTVRWTFWPSIFMGGLLLLAGPYLLALFGSEFATGYPFLLILVVGIVARASVGPAESVLNMAGQQNICALVYGITLAINVMLNVSLIPIYGLYGAAWATSAAMFFEAAALFVATQRFLDIRMFIFSGDNANAQQSVSKS